MRRRDIRGAASLLLGSLMAGSALLGPLAFGIIDVRISDTMHNQLIGGEVVGLLLVAPVAILSGVLWLRAHALAPVFAIAPALYALYTYPQFIVGPDYSRYAGNHEHFFPLYLALIVVGWGLAIVSWRELGVIRLLVPPRSVRWLLALLLTAASTIFALAWIASIVEVLNGGGVLEEYEKDPTLFWMIRMQDLGFVIPAALVTAWGLVMQKSWATRLACAFAGFQTLLIAAVAGMAIMMAARNDPAASEALLLITIIMTMAFAGGYVLLVRHAVLGNDHAS